MSKDRANLARLHKLWMRAYRAERDRGGDILACMAAANRRRRGCPKLARFFPRENPCNRLRFLYYLSMATPTTPALTFADIMRMRRENRANDERAARAECEHALSMEVTNRNA